MKNTETKIENMKSQTFGVEVEMYNIKRQDAAKILAEYFGTNDYSFAGTAYSTWIAKDAQGREWKLMRDGSIYDHDDSKKCELVTPILHYEDMETLQEIIRRLRKAGARSNPLHNCGVHIHIGADGHTPQTLRNLANIMASHEDLLIDALGIDSGRLGQWCKVVDKTFLQKLNQVKPKTMDELEDIWYDTQAPWDSRSTHYNTSRYHMLNLHATFTKGTIEFRLFQFDNPADGKYNGLHAGQLKAYIQLCLAMSQMAKDQKSASPRAQQNENPKYAMRTWLLRLGFIGQEFATARDILTKRLSGDAAFRFGRPGEAA